MRALLVPVKSFRHAKERLAKQLSQQVREQLARDLALQVIGAAKGLATFVACDDGEVADFAASLGVFVLWTAHLGLSGAVTEGVAHLGREGFDLVVVAHSDLALVESLVDFGTEDSVTLAPDRRLDGTNVAAVPARSGFCFDYGPGSYLRHRHEATRLGLTLHVVHDWSLAADVDTPEDLAVVQAALNGTLAGQTSENQNREQSSHGR